MNYEAAIRGGSAEPAFQRSALTERKLITEVKRGSREAADELIRRFWDDAYKGAYLILGNHEDAEDVTQEAFISAMKALSGFKRGRPFRPWIRRIVAHKAVDLTRNRTRQVRRDSEIQLLAETSSPEPVPGLSVSDPALARAIADLPFEQRVLVVLSVIFEMQSGEIAKTLGTPRGTVASRLHRGLERLRTTYGGSIDGQ